MDLQAQRRAWDEDGYFILRGFADPAVGQAMEQEVVAAIRADPPSAHQGVAYRTRNKALIMPEARAGDGATWPEELISKVFNTHLSGAGETFARREDIGEIVANLIGPDIDVFQSQFIFKNAGAWGQPWHQDSYYFPFKQQPQVGIWLAISEATLENGCLSVLPGSHRPLEIYRHRPDQRPGANYGYLEIVDQDTSSAVPALMQPGDLLVFHSYLLHRSVDNCSSDRRSATVYHYSVAGNAYTDPDLEAKGNPVHWKVPVRRAAA